MSSTPFTILTGFLGSGKTTLLNRLLRDPRMQQTAVLVNEVGDIGLDHRLIESVANDIVLLESGCVCCSVRDDLPAALASLLSRRRARAVPEFGRIVLETSGIAVPGPIVQLVLGDDELAAQLRIEGIVAVVDAWLGLDSLERHMECAEQVAMADTLVLSKLDLAPRARVASLLGRLQRLNGTAPLFFSDGRDLNPVELFAATELQTRSAAPAVSHRGEHHAEHAQRFTTFALCWDAPVEWCEFEAWLEGLLIARGGDILRLKGLLHVAGRDAPVVVQGVQHTMYPPRDLPAWPGASPRTELSFVTRDFSRTAALRSLVPFFGPR